MKQATRLRSVRRVRVCVLLLLLLSVTSACNDEQGSVVDAALAEVEPGLVLNAELIDDRIIKLDWEVVGDDRYPERFHYELHIFWTFGAGDYTDGNNYVLDTTATSWRSPPLEYEQRYRLAVIAMIGEEEKYRAVTTITTATVPYVEALLWEAALPVTRELSVLKTADTDGDGANEVFIADQQSRILALDGRSGQVVWTSSLTESVLYEIAFFTNDDGARDVLVMTRDGWDLNLTALDGANGDTLWRKPLGSAAAAPPVVYRNQQGQQRLVIPYMSMGLLFPNVPPADILDPRTAQPLLKLHGDSTLMGVVTPILPGNNGEPDIAVGTRDGEVALYRPAATSATGPTTLWATVLDGAEEIPILAPADLNGTGRLDLIALAGYPPTILVGLDGDDGANLWTTEVTTTIESDLVIGDLNGDGADDVFVALTGGEIVAFDGSNGQQLWSQTYQWIDDLPYRWAMAFYSAVMIDADNDGDQDVLMAQLGDPGIYAMDGQTGEMLWSKMLPDLWMTTPEVADLDGDGAVELVVGGLDGVYALSLNLANNGSPAYRTWRGTEGNGWRAP